MLPVVNVNFALNTTKGVHLVSISLTVKLVMTTIHTLIPSVLQTVFARRNAYLLVCPVLLTSTMIALVVTPIELYPLEPVFAK